MRWYIALRYLLSHKRQTLVCIAGVTISVMMFITMDAMMEGFEDKFIVETVESSGHITVHDEPRETRTKILERIYTNPNALLAVSNVKPREDVKKIKNAAGLIQELRHLRGIVAAAPEVDGDAIATYGTKTLTVSILGIDPEQQQKVTTIGKDVVDGNFTRLHSTADGVVIGRGVSDLLGAKLDDEITLAGTTGGRTTSRVVGIFATGVTPVDYSRVYMLINSAQTLLDRKNVINDIIIRTSDYTRAQYYAAQIESIAGYKTESWQESNANFLKIFTVQSIITYIITGALLVVAAFGVLNILIMAVLERVNDIAILKSFGLSCADITWIYVFQGLMIGLIGTVLGEIVGKLGIEGLRRLPIQIEGLVKSEGLLMSESRQTYIVAFFCSMIVVLLAAVYPARRAAKYDPVEVIRGATETLSAEMLAEMLAAPAAIDAPLLEARNVRRVLGTGDMATEVLRGVNLIIRRGEYLSIVGSSGSGKSTLLYLLGGLDRPTRIDVHGRLYDPSSHIYMEEHDTALLTERELALLRNRLVGFVFQFHYLLKEFTAQENVALPMFKLGRLTRNAAMDRAASLLKRLGLSDKIKRRANRLSGGEQQRVAIARALANEPRVLLADEPTGNLDRRNGDLIADIFNELHAGGQSIVMVTHDGALAKRACRRITMDDGRITADEGFVR